MKFVKRRGEVRVKTNIKKYRRKQSFELDCQHFLDNFFKTSRPIFF